jgi:hypothetical protein
MSRRKSAKWQVRSWRTAKPHRWTDDTPTSLARIERERQAERAEQEARQLKAEVPPPLVSAELNQILKSGPAGHRAIRDRWAPMPRPWLPLESDEAA